MMGGGVKCHNYLFIAEFIKGDILFLHQHKINYLLKARNIDMIVMTKDKHHELQHEDLITLETYVQQGKTMDNKLFIY